MAIRRAAPLLAISHHTAERFKEANPAYKAREIHVCHLGIAETTASVPPEIVSGGGGTFSENFALIVGRMSAEEKYKGHDQLLEIWPALLDVAPGAGLVIAGDGDDRPRLERKAKALGLLDQVRFLGRVSDELLCRLYHDCLFFVMPSRNEGFGMVFLEAMRAGKACIGATGAAAEVIENERTGLIVNPDKPEALLSAIQRLFLEPEPRSRMGLAGAERFRAHFTATQFQERFRGLLGLKMGSAAVVALNNPILSELPGQDHAAG